MAKSCTHKRRVQNKTHGESLRLDFTLMISSPHRTSQRWQSRKIKKQKGQSRNTKSVSFTGLGIRTGGLYKRDLILQKIKQKKESKNFWSYEQSLPQFIV